MKHNVTARWARRPTIYEINTWVWLHELSGQTRRPVTLGDVPRETWDALASYGFDAVWLMGVWERSPEGLRLALADGRQRPLPVSSYEHFRPSR